MLQRVKLTNFKCFDRLDLPCAPLTLLCGLNGMGKSSVLQALLVLRQSATSGELDQGRLVLSGELAELGTGRDVLFEGAETDVVAFELQHSALPGPCELSFDYSREANHLSINQTGRNVGLTAWRKVPPLGGNLIYLNAERLGPRQFYGRSEFFARHGNLGARGEYAWNYLYDRQGEMMSSDDPRSIGFFFREQLNTVLVRWLREITPGVQLKLDAIQNTDAVVAGFSFGRPGDVASRPYRATNVGFGLSYTLPVLIALLAPPGTLCLIENPEAHLHPRGQTKLAELAVRAALAGVQVIAETHSDHFIDGVRIAVRDALIQPEEVAIHYFERADGKSVVTSPRVDSDGRLSSWPVGFFDQHEENLARLLAPKT